MDYARTGLILCLVNLHNRSSRVVLPVQVTDDANRGMRDGAALMNPLPAQLKRGIGSCLPSARRADVAEWLPMLALLAIVDVPPPIACAIDMVLAVELRPREVPRVRCRGRGGGRIVAGVQPKDIAVRKVRSVVDGAQHRERCAVPHFLAKVGAQVRVAA
jgi:hypothetical protein